MAKAKIKAGPLHLAWANASWDALVEEVGKEKASRLVFDRIREAEKRVTEKFDFSHLERVKRCSCMVEVDSPK